MKWTYPSLLLYWVWQLAHIIWWNQPLLFLPCRDPFLKGSGFVCNATVSRIRQFDRMRVLQSCEMVSTCTELTYVLGLAGSWYVKCVVVWNNPLPYLSCEDKFPKLLAFIVYMANLTSWQYESTAELWNSVNMYWAYICTEFGSRRVVWWNDPLLYLSCQDSFPILLEFCLFG